MADYRNPQWLLPNCKNLKLPEAGATTGSGLTEDRHSLYSIDFDSPSINSRILIGSSTEIDNVSLTPYSFSFWFKFSSSSNMVLCQKGTTGLSNAHFAVHCESGSLTWYGVTAGITTSSAVNDGNWHNIVFVAESSTVSKIYLDGSLDVTSSNNKISSSSMSDQLSIGAYSTGTYDFDGKIDEFAIFNTALTLSEVQALSTASAPANIMALDKKPIAYYPLGEQARDNTEWQFPNEVLQSHVFDFDGRTDYIDFGDLTFLNSINAFSTSAWFKCTDVSTAPIILNGGTSATDRFYLQLLTSGTTIRYVSAGDIEDVTVSNIADGSWHNVITVHNGTSLDIYLDGVKQNSSTLTTTAPTSNIGSNFFIGRYSLSSANYFAGQMSNIAIWNSDQSTNIANIYNYGTPQSSYTVTPTAWYKLNATNTYAGLNPNWHSALDFSGSSQYVDITQSLSNTSGALSFWINPDTISGTQTFFGYGNTTTTVDFFSVSTYTSGKLRILFRNDASGTAWPTNGADLRTDASVITINKWYHVLLASNGTSYTMYLNGESIALNVDAGSNSGKWFGDISGVTMNKTYIGALNNSSGVVNEFNGQVANVAIFNQSISDEDVLYLYNGGTPQTNISFEPVSWWKLDNLTTGIQDSGSASNNGTNNGATEVTDSVAVDQWNFDNVAHAQTPNFTSALQYDPAVNGEYSLIPFSPNKTIEALSLWFNTTAAASTRQCLINFTNSFSAFEYPGLIINEPGYGDISFIQEWPSNYITYNGGEVTDWSNLVINYNTGTSKYDMYLNGVKLSTSAVGSGTDKISTNGLLIGNRGALYIPFDGFISNVCIFNSSLNETGSNSIKTIYNSGTPLTSMSDFTSLDGWWTLKDTSTSVGGGLYDASSNSNNASGNTAYKGITNVLTPRLNGESDTLPSTALVSSDLQFESPYSNFSLNFDGATNYIDCTNSSVLDITGSISISCWIKSSNTGANRKIIVKDDGGSNRSYQINTNHASLGPYTYFWLGGGNIKSVSTGTPNQIVDGNWHHVVSVFKSGEYIRMYIDGAQAGNTNVTETTLDSANTSFIIATNGYGGTVGIDGQVDEVSIFNKALNQAEISQIYNNGYAADLTSLSPVSWWRLGEDAYFIGNDITLPNKIANAPNGTGSGTQTSILVADAPGSYASGVGTNLAVEDRKGDAPESTANSLSFNMIPTNKISYPAGYTPTQVDNVYSMAFDGVNNYYATNFVNFPTNLTNNFSVSFWVKMAPVSSGVYTRRHPVSVSTSVTAIDQTVHLRAWNTQYRVRIVGSVTPTGGVGTTDISDNQWHNITYTYTYDSSTTYYTVNVYVDGNTTPEVTATMRTTGGYATRGLHTIGVLSNYASPYSKVTGTYFPGNIDEVGMFDYALTPKQIKEDIYNASTTGKTADLNNNSNLKAPVAWYRMGD